jgi:hypothetical protein
MARKGLPEMPQGGSPGMPGGGGKGFNPISFVGNILTGGPRAGLLGKLKNLFVRVNVLWFILAVLCYLLGFGVPLLENKFALDLPDIDFSGMGKNLLTKQISTFSKLIIWFYQFLEVLIPYLRDRTIAGLPYVSNFLILVARFILGTPFLGNLFLMLSPNIYSFPPAIQGFVVFSGIFSIFVLAWILVTFIQSMFTLVGDTSLSVATAMDNPKGWLMNMVWIFVAFLVLGLVLLFLPVL